MPGKSYHTKASGVALATAEAHSKSEDLKLYGSCFCPFVQRVWIALELKRLPYQYVEIDPYAKPQELLEVNPRGLVPALKHGRWSSHQSTVLLEYLEDLGQGQPLLPSDAKQRAHCRLWCDHVNRHIVPTFYRYLQAQSTSDQAAHASTFSEHLTTLINAADAEGPFFLAGSQPGLVDVQLAPWLLRLSRVLTPYRGWPAPEAGSRWEKWVRAVEGNAAVKATTCGDELYLDSYERYAENRPNTSQVANAINAGSGLP